MRCLRPAARAEWGRDAPFRSTCGSEFGAGAGAATRRLRQERQQHRSDRVFRVRHVRHQEKAQGRAQGIVPDGVPGATTGVPPDLVKGYQAPPEPVVAGQSVPGGAPGGSPVLLPRSARPTGAAPAATADAAAAPPQKSPNPSPNRSRKSRARKPAIRSGTGSRPQRRRPPKADPDRESTGRRRSPLRQHLRRNSRNRPVRSGPIRHRCSSRRGNRYFRRRLRPAHSRADRAALSRAPSASRPDRATHELHHRHCRTAECRQVDPVQPAGRPARRAGRRPARRHPRPARGAGAPRRPRFHGDRYGRARRGGAREPVGRMQAQTGVGARSRPMRCCS